MKKIFIFILLAFYAILAKTQVLQVFNSLLQTNDTTFQLQYFKKIDRQLELSIDSFFIALEGEAKKGRLDSGFLLFEIYKPRKKAYGCFIRFAKKYIDVASILKPQANLNREVLGFTFYKSRLIVFEGLFPYSFKSIPKHKNYLFKAIIKQELINEVQKEIDANSDSYVVSTEYPVLAKQFEFDW